MVPVQVLEGLSIVETCSRTVIDIEDDINELTHSLVL